MGLVRYVVSKSKSVRWPAFPQVISSFVLISVCSLLISNLSYASPQSEINAKYQSLGGASGMLGSPVTGLGSTPDGVGHYVHYQFGSIYWHPSTGAHNVMGRVRDKWASFNWEQSPLGYPITDQFVTTQNYVANNFGGGQIYYKAGQGLTVLTQNMAFLPPPLAYPGHNETQSFNALVAMLQAWQPDVVALQEMFIESRRSQLRQALQNLYPYSVDGPDEIWDVGEDGGLMILSRYPIIATEQTVFRACTAEDCLSNKGVLWAHIQAPFGYYDIFNTHTQNPDPLANLPGSERPYVQAQLNHLYSFIQGKRGNKEMPAIITGDFNTDGLDQSLYNDLVWRLGYPIDSWKTLHPNQSGITADNNINFETGDSPVPPSQRGISGERLDYIFYLPGARYTPRLNQTEIVQWQTSAGKDLSDHYGLYTWFNQTEDLNAIYTGNVSRVEAKFVGFHALTLTDGFLRLPGELADSDEVEWQIWINADGAGGQTAKTGRFNGIDTGEYFSFSGPTVAVNGLSNRIEIDLEGVEIDDICFITCVVVDRQSLTRKKLTLWKEQLLESMVQPQRYAIGIMRGGDSEYVGYVEVRAFP